MPTNHDPSHPGGGQLRGKTDLPLILEQLQDQLDNLRAVVKAQQVQIDRQAARIDTLERR